MAPSKDCCILCSCVFYGKQKFFRCLSCKKRVYAKCVVWPDAELQLLSSGARPFKCNICETAEAAARPSGAGDDFGTSASGAPSPCSLRRDSPPVVEKAPAPPSQPVDLDAEAAGLRALLIDALEGISFLTDQVALLREDNDLMRRENAHSFDRLRQEREGDRAHYARVVSSLRAEVCSLRAELLRRPPALQDEVHRSSEKPSFTQVVYKEVSPSATSAPLQSVSSAFPTLPPTPFPLSPVQSVSVLDRNLPTIEKKRRSRACVGASDTCGLVVVPQPKRPKPKAMFVSKLSPSTTSASLNAHLSTLGVLSLSCRRLKTKFDTYASFYISVSEEFFERLNDPAVWPKDCLFKEFRGMFREGMLHSSERIT